MAYNIVEFEDGLQIVPSEWLTENNKECVWPSYTSQIKLNKAIMKRISPSDDWQLYKIIRIFGSSNTYDKAIDKLKLAEQISDIDVNDGNDLKKSRHQRAKKNTGSSPDNSDTSDTSINKLKTRNDLDLDDFPDTPNTLTINKSKICEIKTPLIEGDKKINRVKEISSSSSDNSDRNDTSNDLDEASNISNDLNKSKMTYGIKKPLVKSVKKITKPLIQSNEEVINIQSKNKKISTVTCSKISSQEHRTANKNPVPQNSDTISTSDCNAKIDLDFHNLIIRKLNAVLLNLATIDERLIKLDNNIKRNEDTDLKENEDYDFDLPVDTVEQLQRIDNQLKNKCVAAEMTRQLSLLGGKDHHDVISYMMKHILTNKLAIEYSWAGAKLKNAFKNLRITKCIINAARTSRNNLTNKEVEDIIARWLILAKQRFDRDLKKEERKKICENDEIYTTEKRTSY